MVMDDEWPRADLSVELLLEHMEQRAVPPTAFRRGAATTLYWGADKSLARKTSRSILTLLGSDHQKPA